MRRSTGLALALCIAAGVAAHAQSHGHGGAPSNAAVSADATFASQMMQAMDRMDADMMAAKPTGDPDRDFAAMMIPHHQGAVDMAKIQLIYGRDPVMRRLAQAIIVEQQQEIELMQRFLQKPSSSQP
jgi:uncharacterized protein (DUF305 family)